MGNEIATCGKDAYKKQSMENMVGSGSFATVYKIERKSDNQIFAAKIIQSANEYMHPKEIKKKSKSELKILKEADHPFIIEYIEEFINEYN